jgi:hypothetical protein
MKGMKITMIKLVLLFAALFAVSASGQEQWEHPDSRLGITVFNGTHRHGLGHGEQRCDNCCIRCDGRSYAWRWYENGWSGW